MFLRGHAAIPGLAAPDATGHLLTQAYQSPKWADETVRIAMKQILFAGLHGPPVEEALVMPSGHLIKFVKGWV